MTNTILPILLGFLVIIQLLIVLIVCLWFKGKFLEEKHKSADEILDGNIGWLCNVLIFVISIAVDIIILSCLDCKNIIFSLVLGLIATIEIGTFPFLLEACIISGISHKYSHKGGE